MNSALESDTVKHALVEALDSELVDEVWRRLLASDEAQRLVERIAEAPEIRAAISAQSVGMIEDVGHTIGNGTARGSTAWSSASRAGSSSASAAPSRPTAPARSPAALAFGLDVLIVNLGFSGLAAVAALIASAFTGNGNGVSDVALAVGTTLWFALGSLYLVGFWSLAGADAGHALPRDQARRRGARPAACGESVKRLIGMVLAAIPFGLGFLGILFDERRRAWDDRLSGVDVVYEGNERTPAPWSRLEARRAAARHRPRNDEGPGFPGPSVAACCWLFVLADGAFRAPRPACR